MNEEQRKQLIDKMHSFAIKTMESGNPQETAILPSVLILLLVISKNAARED